MYILLPCVQANLSMLAVFYYSHLYNFEALVQNVNYIMKIWVIMGAVNEGMSRRAIHKAVFESAALVGASVLQVYLLKRMFERKLGTSRV